MAVETKNFKIQTKGKNDIIDISPQVNNIIFNSALTSGIVTICVPASTASILTMEYEEGVQKDLKKLCESLVSSKQKYEHDKALGGGNGVSHIRASLFGPALTLPFINRKLQVSAWEQIVLVDFDLSARTREVIVQLVGE